MQVLKPYQQQLLRTLEELAAMSEEDRVGVLRQMFNPRRGLHVGYIGKNNRSKAREVAQKEQAEVSKANYTGQGDLL